MQIPTVQLQLLPEQDKQIIGHKKRLKYSSKADVIQVAVQEYIKKNASELDRFRRENNLDENFKERRKSILR